MKISEKILFKNEREKTNESLDQERGKIDESLTDQQVKTIQETDALMESDRHDADLVRQQRRSQNDEKFAATDRLTAQRKIEDDNVKSERSLMDIALQRERDINEAAASELFARERSATDKNLKAERVQTDIEVGKSAGLLEDELALHLKTKADLLTRDEFSAIVSHDLKNPIGAILSSAEIILENPEFHKLNSDLKSWVQMIQRNAGVSLRLINDILDMERVAEGKLQVEKKNHCLVHLMNDCVQTHLYAAKEKNIKLTGVSLQTSITAHFDRDRVQQVLSNLIGNAIKFTPEFGTVNVSIRANEKNIELIVKDSGPGIAKNQQAKIFERFSQIKNKDRRGLGLGLYISKMLIEAHDGRIWVDSVLGQGSQFHIELPI